MSDKYEYTLMELDHLQKELAEQGENRAVSFVALARAHIIEMDAEIEDLRDALTKIRDWAKAYPVDMFPEPDMKEVRKALAHYDILIDQVSASNFRWLLSRLAESCADALKEETP